MNIGILRQQSADFKAFIPEPFPPQEHLALHRELIIKHTEAIRLLGNLDGGIPINAQGSPAEVAKAILSQVRFLSA